MFGKVNERRESECPYRNTCHFYGIPNKTPHSEVLVQRLCMEWPGNCEIYKAKQQGRPVPITMWPSGNRMSLGA